MEQFNIGDIVEFKRSGKIVHQVEVTSHKTTIAGAFSGKVIYSEAYEKGTVKTSWVKDAFYKDISIIPNSIDDFMDKCDELIKKLEDGK